MSSCQLLCLMGSAKSRPAAHGPPRPSGPAARRSSGPRPTARDARLPGDPEAHTVLLSSGKSTHMLRFLSGLGAQMKDGEFEFVYHFNNHFNLFFRCMLPSENVAILCCFRLFTTTNRNKDSND